MRGHDCKVIRLQDCKIYPTMAAAAKDIGASVSGVSRAVRRSGSCKGWQLAALPAELETGLDMNVLRMWSTSELLKRGGIMCGDVAAMNGGIIL